MSFSEPNWTSLLFQDTGGSTGQADSEDITLQVLPSGDKQKSSISPEKPRRHNPPATPSVFMPDTSDHAPSQPAVPPSDNQSHAPSHTRTNKPSPSVPKKRDSDIPPASQKATASTPTKMASEGTNQRSQSPSPAANNGLPMSTTGGTLAELKVKRSLRHQEKGKVGDHDNNHHVSGHVNGPPKSGVYGSGVSQQNGTKTPNYYVAPNGDPPRKKFTATNSEIIGDDSKTNCCVIL